MGSSSNSLNTDNPWLEMEINNLRGNITSTRFTQISPIADPNDPLTNLFPLIQGTTNQYLNETTSVHLNQNTLNNYPLGTSFVVQGEVTNDCGDKMVQNINFAKEAPPTVGDISISCPSTP